jgi:arylamine N-acetyltransferase
LNGVMEKALKEIGFEVMRASAGVMRVQAGDAQLGNHLCLLVCLDQPHLIDVGYGGGLAEPLPLSASDRVDRPYHLGLSELGEARISHFLRRAGRSDLLPFEWQTILSACRGRRAFASSRI